MTPNLDANDFVVLDRSACLERLALHRVAAVAITDGALPVVLPALYLLQGEDILVGAAATSVLGRCMPNSIISLCVYDLDAELFMGWTISLTGRAELVTAPPKLVDRGAFRQWGRAGSEQIVVRVGTERISGRQIPMSDLG